MIKDLCKDQGLPFQWIDITSPTKEDLLSVAEQHHLDRRLVEDSLQPEHLPKFEVIDNLKFLIIRIYSLTESTEADTIQELTDKIAIFISSEFIITIHRLEYNFLESINTTDVAKGTCKTTYDVLQRILMKSLQSYDDPLQKLTDDIDNYEAKLFLDKKIPSLLEDIYFTKRKAYVINRVSNLSKIIIDNLKENLHSADLNNLHDTLLRIQTNSEQVVEHATSLLHTYLSITSQRTNEASQRTNEVVRVLTVFSVFFMPLTFIVGVYGMNFDVMPELHSKWGYYGILGFCCLVALIIYGWFKRKKWL